MHGKGNLMLKKFALVAFAALVCSAAPASAQVRLGVGANGVGVSVGHQDRGYRGDRGYRRDRVEVRRDHRRYDRRHYGRNRTVIIAR